MSQSSASNPDTPEPGTKATELPDVLRVQGADAARFLQAQLTLDVEQCENGQAAPFGWCNPAGRLLASGWLVRQDPEYFLLLAATRAPEVATALARYIFRDKVVIEPVALAVDPLDEDADGLHLPGSPPRCFLLSAQAESPDSGRVRRWQRAGIRGGVCELPAALAGRWLPQMLNLDLVGGLSFTKGCFPGQEIVARTHHLGRLKRRLFAFAATAAPPPPGTGIVCGEHKCGEVVASVAVGESSELLAVVALDYARKDLRLEPGGAGSLTPLPLPYEVPDV